MESFRTQFKIPESKNKIDYSCKILSLGSCFSENIGEKLKYYKYHVSINPFGIIYNPESVAQSIEILLQKKEFLEIDLFEHQGVWNSFYHHSRFSDLDKKTCLKKINTSIQKASEQLKKTRFLLITFGTAWVYQLKSTEQVVSNCHKIPAKEFNRFKLSVSDIVARYKSIIKSLQSSNPDINIIFTVSPVRHLKDGASENQLSKATLILAIHELVNEFKNVGYFPSYEIMMDDLRDYRFYNEDLIHPSPVAINYIWEKFKFSCINSADFSTMHEIEKINMSINHKPFQPNSEAHRKFVLNTVKKMEIISKRYKTIDFSEEKKKLQL